MLFLYYSNTEFQFVSSECCLQSSGNKCTVYIRLLSQSPICATQLQSQHDLGLKRMPGGFVQVEFQDVKMRYRPGLPLVLHGCQ